ncbi:cyclic AMP-dependent transcription factor ATF-4 [Rhinoderma darwinii]|uniref:cyclic AMP-dependent transcription factor ATF-4 n=1 Tax=Rhinoderma darwinii TaxID=43563 RepID=UPI003F67FE6E
MSLLSEDTLLGDFQSPFNQSFLVADESLGLLDDYIEVSGYLPSHGYSSDQAKNGIFDLPVDEFLGSFQGDAFSGMDWMVEKMDLKEFNFDSLLGIEDPESTVSPDELMATLDDSCDLIEDPPLPVVFGQYGPSPNKISLAKLSLVTDQVDPLSPNSIQSQVSSPDHSFILDVGSEVDVAEDKKTSATYALDVLKCEKEDSSDNDSGICTSPSYVGSLQNSPTSTVEYPSSVQCSPASPISERPKPYDLSSKDRAVSAKVKAVGQPKVDKKTKKMEQNKTAATRYRQKKRAEQDAISAECRELESKNDVLQEAVDSLAKEIQYLKDLMEEVRKAKSKRAKNS